MPRRIGSRPINLGADRQAWFTPEDQVVVLGPAYSRPNIPRLLPAFHTERLGNKQLEWFPFGESRTVTSKDIDEVTRAMKEAGVDSDDNFRENYVRLMDGTVWRVDPGSLRM